MFIFNIFDRLDEMERAVRAQAREAILLKTLAEAQGAHPQTKQRLESLIVSCREELVELKRLRNATRVGQAVVVETKGGSC
jgi:hypothetical protein